VRDDQAGLRDVIEAIDNIERYSIVGKARFLEDELIRTYIIHYLQVLGEAGAKLSADLRGRHPEVPWPKILGMRHVLVHDYFRINYDIVWDVVEAELPALKSQLVPIIKELQGTS
jgi:uncharacterized protein with HEPN domain